MRNPLIVVLSGPIAVGKSTLSAALVERFGFYCVKTRSLLKQLANDRGSDQLTRAELQHGGADLDKRTDGKWIADATAPLLKFDGPLVVDSVRTAEQVAHMRRLGVKTVHVHLDACRNFANTPSGVTLPLRNAQRYPGGIEAGYEAMTALYQSDLSGEPVDVLDGTLERIADVCIDTTRLQPEDIAVRVAAALGLYNNHERLVDVLVGGQWGSEGKGQVSGYLAPEYDVLVRVGGPNAGHKVYELPKPYTFYHLPSGTRCNRRAQIVLGPGAVLGLPKLMEEISDCALSGSGRLFIDPQAMVIDAADVNMENHSGSAVAAIGSTGQGVGAATARKALRSMAASEFNCPVQLARDIPELKEFIRPTLEVLDRAFAAGKRVFLEGTQGTSLSLHHGAYPYVTSRDTTVSGTLSDAGISPLRVRKSIMVCRSYPIRVKSVENTSGPMGQEIDFQEVARRSGFDGDTLVQLEKTTTTKRNRRVAEFNWAEFRRSVSLNGPTDIALTFADYYGKDNQQARRYEQLNAEAQRQVEAMEQVSGAPVSLIATRFHFRSIVDRRHW